MFKNVIKRGGHRACFHATILTNMVIFVTFGYLSAQQISSIFFFNAALYITQSDFLWLFIHLRPGKMSSNTLHFLDMHFSARYVSPCRIYFICQKGSHRFLLSFCQLLKIPFFSWNYEIKNMGHRARFRENKHLFLCPAQPEGNLFCMCTRSTTRSFASANDAKIVHSRNAQCNTEEPP